MWEKEIKDIDRDSPAKTSLVWSEEEKWLNIFKKHISKQ